MKLGIDYFSLATDIKDDDKIFELKYRYGMPDDSGDFNHAAAWSAYGRFIELLASIYHEGFMIEVTKAKELHLSQQLGLTLSELREFIETCVEIGLFEESFWKSDNVLTSNGIQKRYFHAVKRRNSDIPENMKRFIIDDSKNDDIADTLHTACIHDASSMQASQAHRIEDNRIVNNKKEDERKGAQQTSDVENVVENTPDQIPSVDSLISNLSNHFSSSPETRQHLQPYPLSCFSLVGSDSKFLDLMEQSHDTAFDALVASFRQRTGTGDVDSFVKSIAKKCPCKCSESPEQVSQCFALIMKALKKFDRTKCHSPTPLVLKVLEDRTVGDG